MTVGPSGEIKMKIRIKSKKSESLLCPSGAAEPTAVAAVCAGCRTYAGDMRHGGKRVVASERWLSELSGTDNAVPSIGPAKPRRSMTVGSRSPLWSRPASRREARMPGKSDQGRISVESPTLA
jgi:hypothetical protein